MIKTIVMSLFRSSETQQLADRIIKILESTKHGHPLLINLSNKLKKWNEMLTASRGNSSRNSVTSKLAVADEARDNAFRAFSKVIEGYVFSNIASLKSAGQVINEKLRAYDSQLYNLGYTDQSAELKRLFLDLDKVKKEINKAGNAAELYEDLKAKQEAFERLFEDKSEIEEAKKLLISTAEAQEKVLKQLVSITNYINIVLSEEENEDVKMKDLARSIDQAIVEVETIARARQTRKAGDNGVEVLD